MTRGLLFGAAALIVLLGAGCTTAPSTGDRYAKLKAGCTENQYLTGPRFPTCNNF